MIHRRQTWTRFFTWTYWRFQIAAWWTGKLGLDVIETFEIEIPLHNPPNNGMQPTSVSEQPEQSNKAE